MCDSSKNCYAVRRRHGCIYIPCTRNCANKRVIFKVQRYFSDKLFPKIETLGPKHEFLQYELAISTYYLAKGYEPHNERSTRWPATIQLQNKLDSRRGNLGHLTTNLTAIWPSYSLRILPSVSNTLRKHVFPYC